ncbi:MAG: hypothetical protein ACTHJ5_04420 [Ilyomonas sp.]
MRPLLIVIFTAFVLMSCNSDYNVLRSAEKKLNKSVSLSLPLSKDSDSKKTLADDDYCCDKQRTNARLPISKFAWDTKMMFW